MLAAFGLKAQDKGHQVDHTDKNNPISIGPVATDAISESWKVHAGYDIEYEHDLNLQMLKNSIEYGFQIAATRELAFSLDNELKFNGYISTIFGLGFTKSFLKK